MKKRRYTVGAFAVVLVACGASAACAASFDCSKARARVEHAICASEQVSQLDSDLASAFADALAKASDPGALKSAQRAWLRQTRDTCQDEGCLVNAYRQRVAALKSGSPAQIAATEPAGATTTRPLSGADSAQIADGYTLMFTEAETKQWWKPATELDRNGWKFSFNRAIGPDQKVVTDKFPFNCASAEIGLPLGPKDSDIKWAPIGKGSELEKVLKFICGPNSGTASVARVQSSGPAAPTPNVSPAQAASPALSAAELQELDQVRLGKCAAQYARAGGAEKAEEMMGFSSNRLRTRTAYAKNLQVALKDPDGAKEESMDACRALGMVKGSTGPTHPNSLTPYEAGKAVREAQVAATQRARAPSGTEIANKAALIGSWDCISEIVSSISTQRPVIDTHDRNRKNTGITEQTNTKRLEISFTSDGAFKIDWGNGNQSGKYRFESDTGLTLESANDGTSNRSLGGPREDRMTIDYLAGTRLKAKIVSNFQRVSSDCRRL